MGRALKPRVVCGGWGTLYLGDCLERMKEIPDKGCNMVLCDLPYGTTRNRWDTVIPFEPLWAEYRRICTGAMVFTATQPFTSALVASNFKDFRYDWCWRKPKGTGHLNAKKQPMRNKEDILVFSVRPPPYAPQMSVGTPYKKTPSSLQQKAGTNWGTFGAHREENYGTRYPTQVIEFGVVERDTVHPTQKPVELMEYLIRTYTNEGETVLDNTMGSGTTGVAAINAGRKFIGIEKDQGYFEIAVRRIKEAQK